MNVNGYLQKIERAYKLEMIIISTGQKKALFYGVSYPHWTICLN